MVIQKKIHTPSRPIKDPNKNNPNNKIKELQERCNKLERALDKSCGELSNMYNDIDDEKNHMECRRMERVVFER